ncbi:MULTISPECIES: type IV pilus biogenesis/stability protein PilW [Halomonas]|uniref:Type IV pilus biogenesis/stability protein PilW n=2 Tax=Halomonas TaxID=2745 RepID=A0ABQ0U369_9GAMM|nr:MULTISPECIES: type IV pilus biogenesis/stability protein PilW [Halomonas]PSJ22330.1 type IV pilus biogenesis/stability protein PilW [Halomonas sp. ND22Bw]KGE78948.1 pilus assembly protein PilF [Halomonas salina]MDR5888547.1 type IV pilus biogenesis/stability protein PilW [Halomonas salina]RAH37819.1 type IV pilus biogenesis/stability protein PilW [Halomonas sp. SL1]WJY07728.1 type IV pilus biogenesis/stability protein PilW [Halomonas halophila]
MTRRPHGSRLLSVTVVLASVLWLTGCATRSDVAPPAADTGDPVAAYTRLGTAYLERNNLPRALSALDRALEIDDDAPEALQAMAIVYQRQGEDALADETFQQAIDAAPDLTRARNNYAAFLYDQGRIREACHQLEQAAADTQYANRAQLFTNLGQCQRRLGDIEAARHSLQRAQSIDPRRADSYLRLAQLEVDQGRYAVAEQQLQRYRRLAGPTPAARQLSEELSRARGERSTAAVEAP